VEGDLPNMPMPLGDLIIMSYFVNADHAGNKVTRKTHNGNFILVKNAPITVHSKQQNM
jgi:hypothetical protein